MPDIKRTCKDCNKEFHISEGQQKWFKSKGFSYPVRCEACRARRRKQREANKNE